MLLKILCFSANISGPFLLRLQSLGITEEFLRKKDMQIVFPASAPARRRPQRSWREERVRRGEGWGELWPGEARHDPASGGVGVDAGTPAQRCWLAC